MGGTDLKCVAPTLATALVLILVLTLPTQYSIIDTVDDAGLKLISRIFNKVKNFEHNTTLQIYSYFDLISWMRFSKFILHLSGFFYFNEFNTKIQQEL